MRKRFAVTFASEEPLGCRLTMLVVTREPTTQSALCDQLAAITRTRTEPVGTRAIEAQFTEPLELVVAARELATQLAVSTVRGIVASAAARDLLADADEPTASAWHWLLQQLAIRSAPNGAFAAASGIGAHAAAFEPSQIAIRHQAPPRAPGIYEVSPSPVAQTTRLFDQEQIIVGRADGVDIQIVEDSVARKHCAFVRRGRAWFLEDKGSTGGVYFEDERVDNVAVVTGDRFRFGRSDLEIVAVL